MWRVLTAVTRLASREDDGVGHEIDGLLGRKPAHVAERQMEAAPDEPEEKHVDVFQVFLIDCGDDLHCIHLFLSPSLRSDNVLLHGGSRRDQHPRTSSEYPMVSSRLV